MVNVWPAMFSVPVRRSSWFCATRYATVPLPVPEPPSVMTIHEAPLVIVAVHAHPPPVVIETEPSPLLKSNDWLVGLIEDMHALACETVKILPAMVKVPERALPTFASTEYRTDPVPVPVAPEVMVIQGASLVATHAHPAAVVTVTGAGVPPVAAVD